MHTEPGRPHGRTRSPPYKRSRGWVAARWVAARWDVALNVCRRSFDCGRLSRRSGRAHVFGSAAGHRESACESLQRYLAQLRSSRTSGGSFPSSPSARGRSPLPSATYFVRRCLLRRTPCRSHPLRRHRVPTEVVPDHRAAEGDGIHAQGARGVEQGHGRSARSRGQEITTLEHGRHDSYLVLRDGKHV